MTVCPLSSAWECRSICIPGWRHFTSEWPQTIPANTIFFTVNILQQYGHKLNPRCSRPICKVRTIQIKFSYRECKDCWATAPWLTCLLSSTERCSNLPKDVWDVGFSAKDECVPSLVCLSKVEGVTCHILCFVSFLSLRFWSFYLAERTNCSLAQFPGSPPFSCTHVSSLSPAVWTWGVAQWCSALLCVTWHFYPALRGAESAVSTWGIPLTSIVLVSCFKTAFYCQVVKKNPQHIRINEMQLIDL